jgi:hypothetical protein
MEHLGQVWNLEKARLLNADHFLLTASGGFFNQRHRKAVPSPERLGVAFFGWRCYDDTFISQSMK